MYLNRNCRAEDVPEPPPARPEDSTVSAIKRLNGGRLPYVGGNRLRIPQDVVYEAPAHAAHLWTAGELAQATATQTGCPYRLEVFYTRTKGWGVRSWDPIPAHAYVAEFTGKIVTAEAMRRVEAAWGDRTGCARTDYTFDLQVTSIDERRAGDGDGRNGPGAAAEGPGGTGSEGGSSAHSDGGSCGPTPSGDEDGGATEGGGSAPSRPQEPRREVGDGGPVSATAPAGASASVPDPAAAVGAAAGAGAAAGRAPEPEEPEEPEEDGPKYMLDGYEYGSVARFINHDGSHPNLWIQCVLSEHHDLEQPRVCLFAMEDIPPLTELCYDYGRGYEHFKLGDSLLERRSSEARNRALAHHPAVAHIL